MDTSMQLVAQQLERNQEPVECVTHFSFVVDATLL